MQEMNIIVTREAKTSKQNMALAYAGKQLHGAWFEYVGTVTYLLPMCESEVSYK